MIRLSKVSKAYREGHEAQVRAVDLSVARGEFLVLVGPSGCGKTTTLSMINRLVEPSSGQIEVDGENIREIDAVALRRRIGFVFQNVGLFPHLTCGENIAITPRLMGLPPPEIEGRVKAALQLVRLPPDEFRSRLPASLSGGQKQRVGVARALAQKPSIMLMDEPFGALDPLIRDELASEYRDIHNRLGLTTVLVTHDMTEAMILADRIAIMRAGTLVQIGRPRELADEPVDDFVRELLDTPRRRAKVLADLLREEARK